MENRTKIKVREAQMDILRIISMCLIILLHSIDHSGVLENTANCSGFIQWYVQFLYALSQVCVNCFVLISGYYMISSKFRLSKLVILWMETVFYALLFRIIFIGAGIKSFSLASLISCVVPILTGRYWFITIYVGLYMLSPFLNHTIESMNRRQHRNLNIVLLLLLSVWSSITPGIAGMNSGGGWGLTWFVVLYFNAAWVRKYSVRKNKCLWRYFIVWLAIGAGMASLKVLIASIPILNIIVKHWYRYDSIWALIASVSLLLFFHNMKITNDKILRITTMIAPATFGVYLIHAHADVSPWLWETLNLPGLMNSVLFPCIQIGVVLLIFITCVLIDLVRVNTIGRIEKQEWLYEVCDYLWRKILDVEYKVIGDKDENISN